MKKIVSIALVLTLSLGAIGACALAALADGQAIALPVEVSSAVEEVSMALNNAASAAGYRSGVLIAQTERRLTGSSFAWNANAAIVTERVRGPTVSAGTSRVVEGVLAEGMKEMKVKPITGNVGRQGKAFGIRSELKIVRNRGHSWFDTA